MANLKDTIVLGNLTVTGTVVASDILANGTGNEFDTIKVNNIYSSSDLEIIANGDLLLSGSSNLAITSDSNVSLVTSTENGEGSFNLTANAMAITTVDAGAFAFSLGTITSTSTSYITLDATTSQISCHKTVVPSGSETYDLGGAGKYWNWTFSNYITGNYMYANQILPRYSGTSDDSSKTARNGAGSIGTSSYYWGNVYTNHITMPAVIMTSTGTTPTIAYNPNNTIYPYRTQNSSINGGSGTQCAYTHYGPSGNYKVTIPSLSVTVGNPSSTTHSLNYSFAGKSASSIAHLSYAYGGEYTYYTGATSTTSISSVTLTYGSTYYFKVTGSAAKYQFIIGSIYLTPLSKTDNQGTISINSPSTTIYAGQTVIGCKSDSAYDIAIGSSGQRYCAIASPTAQWTYVSDKRDKTDIETIQTALGFVKQLTPITYVDNMREYYFNDDGTFNAESHAKGIFKKHRRRAGFLAQDVYETMINEYGTDNYASVVDYNKYKPDNEETIDRYSFNGVQLIPFLVKAVQEQQEIIDKLQARIEILEQGDK